MQAESEPLSTVADRANSDRHRNVGKYRLLIVISLLIACFLLTYTFHVVLNSGSLFSHFFYIPIVLSAFWWKRKGLVVSIILGMCLIFSRRCCVDEAAVTFDDYLRALLFVVTAVVVVVLSERIENAEAKVRESEARYRSMFEYMNDGVAVLGAVENGRCGDMDRRLPCEYADWRLAGEFRLQAPIGRSRCHL